ncbi:MAG TPA: GNAT family N-acetyltransferase [Pelagibacterium sp.]|uniref:GNAT family N-acetyltransferase n=1 Tax=Pelagibacterium sp. TaxID=1967288 RepID=UPI002CB9E298|nr:GNAT family N-acetyltransferase [Pelagibacterium sp.]HWJ88188.1 GNAT family N-acetyltransferase [Pelagibacterium sp.]
MTLAIRQIGPRDAGAYRTIRLAALAGDPASFASDAELEQTRPLDWYETSAARNAILIAFEDTVPVGMAGLVRSDRQKTRHIGAVFGVYVAPSHRRTGVATGLMDAIIATARPPILQLHLGVAANNLAALALYHRLGFTTYGTQPRALHVEGRFIDEHLMVRFLDKEF